MKRPLSLLLILVTLFLNVTAQISFLPGLSADGQHDMQQPDAAHWSVSVANLEDNRVLLLASLELEDGWHVYSQHHKGSATPLSFSFSPVDGYVVSKGMLVEKPSYTEAYDSVMKETERTLSGKIVFSKVVDVTTAAPFDIPCHVEGQICRDGMCRPESADLLFHVEYKAYSAPSAASEPVDVVEHKNEIAETADSLYNQCEDKENIQKEVLVASTDTDKTSLWLFFWIAFGGGLLGLLTPCVFPMIPMTVSYFMKHGGRLQAVLYGVSIVVIYMIFGILLSALFGQQFANQLSTHWLPNIIFALVFVVFAFSLFGYYEITLPSWLLNKSAKGEEKQGYAGTFFMALTLVLVSFSCTLPVAGAVALGSADGTFIKPFVGMLGFSLAFALPFTFFAFFPSLLSKLPRSGGWMNVIKVSLAFVELAFALKFINVPDQTYHWGILDREIYLAIWIVIFALWGFYLLGKLRFPLDDEYPVQKSPVRFTLALAVFAFVVYMIPGMWGAPLNGISGWLPPMHTQDFRGGVASDNEGLVSSRSFAGMLNGIDGTETYFDYDEAIEAARLSGKPLFIDFTGHGCVNCRKMEQTVLADEAVVSMLASDFVTCVLYVDDKVLELPENLVMTTDDGRMITMLGEKNFYIQNSIFRQNSQPCCVIVSSSGDALLAGPMGYSTDAAQFASFLQSGTDASKIEKQ